MPMLSCMSAQLGTKALPSDALMYSLPLTAYCRPLALYRTAACIQTFVFSNVHTTAYIYIALFGGLRPSCRLAGLVSRSGLTEASSDLRDLGSSPVPAGAR